VGLALSAVIVHRFFAARLTARFTSPWSPCPGLAAVFAALRRSAAKDRPTSSDSLNVPSTRRFTKRLSVPVSIDSRFVVNRLTAFFTAFFAMVLRSVYSVLVRYSLATRFGIQAAALSVACRCRVSFMFASTQAMRLLNPTSAVLGASRRV
jgi:hypothetical protein